MRQPLEPILFCNWFGRIRETRPLLPFESCRKAGTEVWAYCLMTNHVHLVMVPATEDGLRAALGEAHRQYTRHVNFREGCRGHLWQKRFHSFAMDEYYLLTAVRYVEMNPVHAGMVRQAENYPWSSARAHLAGRDDGLVRVQPMLDRIGNWREYLDSRLDDGIVETFRRHSRTGRPLGDESFLNLLESKLGRKLRPGLLLMPISNSTRKVQDRHTNNCGNGASSEPSWTR